MIDSRSRKSIGAARWPRFAVVLAAAVSLGACSGSAWLSTIALANPEQDRSDAAVFAGQEQMRTAGSFEAAGLDPGFLLSCKTGNILNVFS